ncbi:MAG: orotate phosphoribosyltransferase [Chloroflexi bacterium]|nr:orotate phosphoribosyltransferase [Chloroflexota bacterium]
MTKTAELIFREAGAFLEGHFLLTSGLHSPIYLEKFHVLQYPHYTAQLCRMIARHFQKDGVQVVAGPTVGGILIAFEVARSLGVRGIFAERDGDGRSFRRGFSLLPKERVLVVDDILTTGGSIREVIAEVKRWGGEVMGVGVLADRAKGKSDFGVPLYSCFNIDINTYEPADCPQCKAGLPLVRPGG